jgi:cobalamin biosynthesis protein CbiG
MKRLVVVGVSDAGSALATRIADHLGGEAQLLGRRVSQELPKLFTDPTVGGLVVVLAVGAAVRLLAPWLRGKDQDPAVVAVDDAGRFAIALLSGHRGGANRLADEVARAIGATAVVTTASDVARLPAIDLLGRDQGWKIEASPEMLRRTAAAVVNHAPVAVFQDAGAPIRCPGHRIQSLEDPCLADMQALLIVTDRLFDPPAQPRWQVVYRPPTLVAGVGCSRGATLQDITHAIQLALLQGQLASGSLAQLATIDRRLNEPGLVALAEHWSLRVRGFAAGELAAVQVPSTSEVVRNAVGTPGVCEPAALLASGAAELLVPKVKTARATAAIARTPERSGEWGMRSEE